MALHKISDFDTDYHNTIQGKDIKGMSVYSRSSNEKIGTVGDILVDDQGQFRYLLVDLGFWIFGKKVLLPLGRAQVDSREDRVYTALTKQQAEDLPEFKEDTVLDYDYEERVRKVYRTPSLEASAPLDTGVAGVGRTTPTYDRNTYNYSQDVDLYDTNAHEDTTIRLYEERLVANKQRRKAGEVTIGKHVETETARVAVPIEKERVVIERVTPTDAGRVVSNDVTAFREGEVAHVEIYEEVPDIRKEAVVREEVRVRKVVDQETVETQETIRREELDIDTNGQSVVNRTDRA
ncbi:PRC-barrel domain-containing protein AvaK [Calothrix sp. NIES-4071]|nr:PRC-barrel domain-containing protein AvaK [Calothrix sp. NIES-4071]BAZ63894.1 PRC-barrel domain-containing protein AvaK [Calothrix sp. NIES-4105]